MGVNEEVSNPSVMPVSSKLWEGKKIILASVFSDICRPLLRYLVRECVERSTHFLLCLTSCWGLGSHYRSLKAKARLEMQTWLFVPVIKTMACHFGLPTTQEALNAKCYMQQFRAVLFGVISTITLLILKSFQDYSHKNQNLNSKRSLFINHFLATTLITVNKMYTDTGCNPKLS